jgi:DNA-binding LacI/PurR family transcriptional regulator
LKVTLKDIAGDTGYSISTISRVLNGSDKISTRTRREVYQSAKKLKYPIYRSLNGEKLVDTLNVSLVLTRYHIGEFYASFYEGFNSAAENQDVNLSLVSLKSCFEESLERIKDLAKKGNDGLILFAHEFTASNYNDVLDIIPDNFPIVSNALIENPVFSTVTFDGYSGGFLAARAFSKKGYVKCGIIHGAFDAIEARYRSNGFRDYILQSDEMELVWNYDGDFSFESGKEAFKDFQRQDDDKRPRAIFASNDAMCHAFMEEALMQGYDVPGNIALIGYDDLPICERHRPSISSIHTNYQRLGEITMSKLKELLASPKQEQGLLSLVPVRLNVRESS